MTPEQIAEAAVKVAARAANDYLLITDSLEATIFLAIKEAFADFANEIRAQVTPQ